MHINISILVGFLCLLYKGSRTELLHIRYIRIVACDLEMFDV